MTDKIAVDICICTFRRSHIAETLRSVSQLRLKPEWNIRVIVADNDDEPSAQVMVATTARETGLPVTYLHAPARNISIARNACLEAATAPLVAFIDDDELVTPGWLDAMLWEMNKSNADAVLGPVNAIYPPECPAWMRKGDFHSTRPVWVHDTIVTGYSCNVFFRADSPALKGMRFRKELGRSGGEDTVFFAQLVKAGGRIAYAPDAVVTEEVTPNRARFSWLLTRRFRSGQTHGLLLLEKDGTGWFARAINILKATAKALFCGAMTLLNILTVSRLHYWMMRGTVHVGVISRLLGKADIEPYGQAS